MLGRDHALTGAAAYAAAAPALLHVTGWHLAIGVALATGAGTLPDIDHHDSSISGSFGSLTNSFSWLVNKASGGHRHGTHSFTGIAVFTAATVAATLWPHPGTRTWQEVPVALLVALLIAAGLRALRIGGHHADLAALTLAGAVTWFQFPALVALLPVAVATGCAAHIAGDALTHGGVPLFWPFTRRDFHFLPKPMQFTTGKTVEHWIITPALTVLLAAAIARTLT